MNIKNFNLALKAFANGDEYKDGEIEVIIHYRGNPEKGKSLYIGQQQVIYSRGDNTLTIREYWKG